MEVNMLKDKSISRIIVPYYAWFKVYGSVNGTIFYRNKVVVIDEIFVYLQKGRTAPNNAWRLFALTNQEPRTLSRISHELCADGQL